MSEFDTNELVRRDLSHVWHPFTQAEEYEAESPHPLVVVEGDGNYLIDSDGNRYLDGISSLWVNVHGHREPRIDAAIRSQLDQVAHTTMLGATHPTAVDLASKLAAITPEGLTRVFYSDSGSTAVEVALKMAYQYWLEREGSGTKRTGFLSFSGAYHGDTIGSVSVGGIDTFHEKFNRLLFPVIHSPSGYCYRCELGLEKSSCDMACASEFERLLDEHQNELAAVIIEPLAQGASGIITWPEGFLKRVRQATSSKGILLIADEVATGFGRTGTMFACEQEDVIPDLLCMAKGITGGYLPLAATVATEQIFDAFRGPYTELKTFFHGHSYTGNPLACSAALANLRIFEEDETIAAIQPKIDLLAECLESVADLKQVGEIRQRGLMIGIELVENKEEKKAYPADLRVGRAVTLAARKSGVIIRPLGDVVVLMPPLSITPDQIRLLVRTTREAIIGITEKATQDV